MTGPDSLVLVPGLDDPDHVSEAQRTGGSSFYCGSSKQASKGCLCVLQLRVEIHAAGWLSVRLEEEHPDVRNQNFKEGRLGVSPHLQQVGRQEYKSPPTRTTSILVLKCLWSRTLGVAPWLLSLSSPPGLGPIWILSC